MNKEVISKLVSCKYESEDNMLGKAFLLKEFPELRKHLRQSMIGVHGKRVSRALLKERFGIDIGVNRKEGLVFKKKDFPELWENQE